MDIQVLENYIKTLKDFFNEIEYFDLDEKIKVVADKDGKTTISSIDDSNELSHVLNKAFVDRKKLIEIDYVNGQTFVTISNYCKENDKNIVLKLKFEVDDKVVVNATGKGKIVEEVMKHNFSMFKDPLTGVYNRSYFDSHLMSTDVNALAMIDVDDFKKINDTYGHLKGDDVLAVIAQTIEKASAGFGTVVRYGGDEFVIVFTTIEKSEFNSQLKKICNDVNKIKIDGIKEKLSVSVGGVYGFGNLRDVIRKADKLMYEAKQTKNNFVYADSDKI